MTEQTSMEEMEMESKPHVRLTANSEEACLITLRNLLADPDLAKSLSAEETTELVHSISLVLKGSSEGTESEGNVAHLATCLEILCRLCRGDPMQKATSNNANIAICATKEVCEAVSNALAKNTSHPKVAQSCGLLVMILSCDNTKVQESFSQFGACSHLVKALQDNIESPNILELLLRACRNLGSNLSVASRLVSDGIPQEVNTISEKYMQHAEVIEAVLWLVVNVSCDADVATILGAVGVCKVVADILAVWMEVNEDITRAACWAIRNLSVASACNYAVLDNTTAILNVISALNKYKTTNSKISESALWALSNLGFDAELSQKMLENDIVKILAETGQYILTRDGDLMNTPAMFSLIAMDEAFLWAVRNISAASEGNNVFFNEPTIQQTVVLLLREYGRDPKFAEVTFTHMNVREMEFV